LLNIYSEAYPSIYADFGTLSHSFVEEGILLRKEPAMGDVLKTDSSLLKLSDEEKQIFLNGARNFRNDFLNSNFYKNSVVGNSSRCEVGFFSQLDYKGKKTVAEGFIDLLIKDGSGNYIVVDFKTDTIKNPSIHQTQLSTYKSVVEQMHPSSKVKCALVYLRAPDDEYYFE
jgi:ATP-dependent exoDNAse (exonuclease V) beta subunit